MNTRPWIGNDIVDLAEAGVAGKEQDRRFMCRVFTPAERARILEAAAPTIALWKAWSAKETAFKIAGKIREGVVFAHQRFEVTAEPVTAGPSGWIGTGTRARVRFEDLEIRVRWETALDYVHCIGQLVRAGSTEFDARPRARDARRVLAGILPCTHALRGALTTAEQASVHSAASERVRLLARRLMARWDLQGAEVLRLWREWGWSPPLVAREGEPVPGFDVSLSHDGRFIAAAMAGPI